MAYSHFSNDTPPQDYAPLFNHQAEEDIGLYETEDDFSAYDPDENWDLEEEDTWEETDPGLKAWRSRLRWQMLAGIGDFAGVVIGTVLILLLILLLISLFTWVEGDIRQSFTLLQK